MQELQMDCAITNLAMLNVLKMITYKQKDKKVNKMTPKMLIYACIQTKNKYSVRFLTKNDTRNVRFGFYTNKK